MKTELKQVGDLKVGDKLIGSDGKPTEVTAVYEKHLPKRMFELEMEDGTVIAASGNHLWYSETTQDIAYKSEYMQLAKDYFESEAIPPKMIEDGHFPLPIFVQLFGDNIRTQLFIEKAARGLGYSSYTPIVSQEMMKSGKPVDISEEIVYNYSYNDFIDFLIKMKLAIIEKEGYFYFGEVRTTEEIFDLMNKGIAVNIPTKQDIIKNKHEL